MVGYVKYFDNNNKKMSFIADDKELLKKCIRIWKKISELIGKKFSSKFVWYNKCINSKIKSYKDSVITNFQGEGENKKVPNDDLSCKCLSLIMLDSVIKTGKKYYPQTLLEECKYKITKKKMKTFINADFDLSSKSDNESGSESDNESGSESDEVDK